MSKNQNRLKRLAKAKRSTPDGAFGRLTHELDHLRVAGRPLSQAIEERAAVLRRYVDHPELAEYTRESIRGQIEQLDQGRQRALISEQREAERRSAAETTDHTS